MGAAGIGGGKKEGGGGGGGGGVIVNIFDEGRNKDFQWLVSFDKV